MKNILKLFCLVLVLFCIYFPITYFNKGLDKKEIKTSHILVNSEQEAKDIKNKIEAKEITFEEAAKKYSKCPSSEYEGDLGYNEHGRMFKEFEDVVFNMPKMVISEPIKTQAGWHLAKVYDIRYFSDKENFERKYYLDDKEIDKLLNK